MGDRIPLDLSQPIWQKVFMVAPLIIVGTIDGDRHPNFAPKHMAMPLGWANYFAFVCTPRHRTYQNILQQGEFSVSYPKADQIVLASLSATAREDDGSKPIVAHLPSFPASVIDAPLFANSYLFLECRLGRILDDFGENSLILGKIVAAQADPLAFRDERDDADILHDAPLLAYLPPGRYYPIDRSFSFPFPASMTL